MFRTARTFALAPLMVAAAIACPTLASANPAGLQSCAMSGNALGVERVVEIDTTTGPLFGAISRQARESRFLQPKEVVLTFDDGPMPTVTRSILDTLDRFCTKATFFSVGRMALAYPAMVRNILDRGHTLGTHTWSHPLNLKRLSLDKANEEIEKGYAAVTMAAGRPIAPFFRFPGLSDSGPMLKHLQKRGIAAFSVDAVSNDSYISDPEKLLQHALKEVEANKGGIVLFHDIKPATARMLPKFLAELQARGYRIVHMRAKGSVDPLPEVTAKLAPIFAKQKQAAAAQPLVPFYGLVKPGSFNEEPAVTEVNPAAKQRPDSDAPVRSAAKSGATRVSTARATITRTAVRGWTARSDGSGGWNATVTTSPR